MKQGSNPWLTIICVALLALLGAWFFLTHERVSRDERQPPQGPARINPLYALEKTYAGLGYRVSSQARLDANSLKLAPGDALVLYGESRNIPPSQVDQVLQWVAAGGHLVMPVSRNQGKSYSFNEAFGLVGARSTDVDIDNWFNLDWRCEKLQLPNRKDIEHFCGPAFALIEEMDAELTHSLGNKKDGYLFARLNYGKGTVTAFSQMRFLNNRELEKNSNHQLAAYFLPTISDNARIQLIYSTEIDSLFMLIFRHGWMLLIGAALAITAWLVMRGRRLGPLLPPLSENRRALMEHIHAAGQFAFRRDRGQRLHRSVRDAVLARLHQRHPLGNADDATVARALAERAGMDVMRIERALAPLNHTSSEAFRDAIQTLIEVRNRL